MKKAYIIRNPSDEKQTLGAIVAPDQKAVFVARTLELPWLDNKNDISCIPADTYICHWSLSPHMGIWTYEILNVPGRTGCRLHSANYWRQLKGCCALGDAHKDIDVDGELDVIHSGDTIAAFNKLMNYEDFKLVIQWAS